jgi:Fe-S oxidoreductase
MSVFKEELLRLFPTDARAKHIAERTIMLGAFLHEHGHKPLKLEQDVVVHGHCHHKSVFGLKGETDLLRSSGRDVQILDAGCCGMAGAFGYEIDKYDVSTAIAKKGILPMLAETNNKVIVSDGFSCRHQIMHFTEKKPTSLPELLREAIKE